MLRLVCFMAVVKASGQDDLNVYAAIVDHGYDNIFIREYECDSNGKHEEYSTITLYTTLKCISGYRRYSYPVRYSDERIADMKRRHNVWRQPIDTICREGDWPCGKGYKLDSTHRWISYSYQCRDRRDGVPCTDSMIYLFDDKGNHIYRASYQIKYVDGTALLHTNWEDRMLYNQDGYRYRDIFMRYDSTGKMVYRSEEYYTFTTEGLVDTATSKSYNSDRHITAANVRYNKYERWPKRKKKKKWRPYYDG